MLDRFEDDKNIYLILEFCEGGTLDSIFYKRGRLTEMEAKHYMHQLLLSLINIHRQNIIHRDIKPMNILLTKDLKVKLGDFGFATQLKSKQHGVCGLYGTWNYIAPEMLDEENLYQFSVDIWAFGVTLFMLVAGKQPFDSERIEDVKFNIKRLSYSFPFDIEFSFEFKNLIKKIFLLNPASRLNVVEIIQHDFFMKSLIPSSLSDYCRTRCPIESEVKEMINAGSVNLELLKKQLNKAFPVNWRGNSKFGAFEGELIPSVIGSLLFLNLT
jgi:serine/threonine protein kinase